MRLWEFSNDKSAQLDIMNEQDFILQLRKLKRLRIPHIVMNLKLDSIPSGHTGMISIEETHKNIKIFMQSEKGFFTAMSNGDVFLTWEDLEENEHLKDQILKTVMKFKSKLDSDEYYNIYKLPNDYIKIRTLIDEYMNPSKPSSSSKNNEIDCIQRLKTNKARGELSAWSVDQIECLIKKIDVHHYIRSQPIYKCIDSDNWERICDETFISFDELRQTYIPHTNIFEPKHLFLEVCQFLDKKVLTTLTDNYTSIKGMNLSLNLSITTVLGVGFANFARAIPKSDRGNFGFEIHCGDLLQDFEITLNMIDTMHQEGFNVALDGVSPNMLEYFDFSTLNMDAIKIDVRKDYTKMLNGLKIQKAIMLIGTDKVIFNHCDSHDAIEIGLRLGVSKFQGFLVDDLAIERLKKENLTKSV